MGYTGIANAPTTLGTAKGGEVERMRALGKGETGKDEEPKNHLTGIEKSCDRHWIQRNGWSATKPSKEEVLITTEEAILI
jgi:hypothetical protein